MLIALRRLAISLIAAGSAFGAYVVGAVPLIEPPIQRRAATDGDSPSPVTNVTHRYRNAAMLESLFEPGSWERQHPKAVETDHGVFLCREFKRVGAGRFELRPCTVILADIDDSSAGDKAPPVVMFAPQGVLLQFEADSELGPPRFSKLVSARLPGAIRIRRLESEPGARDQLDITAQNIQIDRQQIWTTQPVEFHYGASFGSGRDLVITLAPPARSDDRLGVASAIGGIKFVELVHLDKLRLELPPRPGASGERERDASSSRGGLLDGAGGEPIEITCQGSFRLDIQEQIVSFEDRVDVVRLTSDGPSDQLSCQELKVHFRRRVPDLSNPAASGKDAMDLELERLVALGSPVILRAASAGATARGQRLEYDVAKRLLHLEDPVKAVLDQSGVSIESPHVQYQMSEDSSRLGRAWAAGPGKLIRRTADGGELETHWGGELRLRPQDNLHVVSLTGGTSIRMSGAGQFSSDALYVWLREERRENGAAGTPARSRYDIELDRLLAQGQVAFDSPRIGCKTQRLEAWFTRQPAADLVAPRVGQRSAGGVVPSLPVSSSGAPSGESPGSRYDVTGDLMRIQIALVGPQTLIDQISVSGGVKVTESAGSNQPGQEPLTVTGDMLQLENVQTPRAELHIKGVPARVQARGLTLIGADIGLSQTENRVWIDGAGEMTLPPIDPRPKPNGQILFENPAFARDPSSARDPSGAANAPPAGREGQGDASSRPAPIVVSWRGGMEFNGQSARFERDVQVRGAYRMSSGEMLNLLVMGGVLDVTLTQPIRFDSPQPTDTVNLAQLSFGGHVYLEGRTTLGGGLTSTESMQLRNLLLDHSTGKLQGEGPGWLSTVRADDDSDANGPRLIYLHIEFAKSVAGNLSTRTVEFTDQVDAIFGPVSRWEETLDPRRPELLDPKGATLKCQRLSVAQMGAQMGASGNAPMMELEATGNAIVEGRQFVARGARVSYAQAKDLLILAGDGRVDAEFWDKRKVNSLKPNAIARTIMYWRRDNRVEVDGAKYFDLSPYLGK